MEFNSILQSKRGRTQSSTNAKYELSMSTYCNKRNNSSRISVYIGIELLKKARIIVGDRVDLLKSDCGKYGLVKRVLNGGLKIGYSGGEKGPKNITRIQTVNNGTVSLKEKVILENVIISDEGILFDWPET